MGSSEASSPSWPGWSRPWGAHAGRSTGRASRSWPPTTTGPSRAASSGTSRTSGSGRRGSPWARPGRWEAGPGCASATSWTTRAWRAPRPRRRNSWCPKVPSSTGSASRRGARGACPRRLWSVGRRQVAGLGSPGQSQEAGLPAFRASRRPHFVLPPKAVSGWMRRGLAGVLLLDRSVAASTVSKQVRDTERTVRYDRGAGGNGVLREGRRRHCGWEASSTCAVAKPVGGRSAAYVGVAGPGGAAPAPRPVLGGVGLTASRPAAPRRARTLGAGAPLQTCLWGPGRTVYPAKTAPRRGGSAMYALNPPRGVALGGRMRLVPSSLVVCRDRARVCL